VLFDPFNEPHDRLPDDGQLLHLVDGNGDMVEADRDVVSAQDWNAWAELLVAEIRREHPDSLILIGGIDWAFDLREVQVSAPNIVYSAHIYPNRKRRHWGRALSRAGEVPIFVAEWGGGSEDMAFGRELASIMQDLELGWAAWSWVDRPQLTEAPRGPQYNPTAFGALVREELQRVAG
jgi:hypothetical protein